MSGTFPVDYGPLDIICLKSNETSAGSMPGLMVLCRSPADDGWICVEDETALIYTIYDTVAYLYRPYKNARQNSQTSGFGTRAKQAELLARAEWFCYPTPLAGPSRRAGAKR